MDPLDVVPIRSYPGLPYDSSLLRSPLLICLACHGRRVLRRNDILSTRTGTDEVDKGCHGLKVNTR